MFGGAIAAGFAVNSNDVLAAENGDVEEILQTEAVQADVQKSSPFDDCVEPWVYPDFKPVFNTMEDATGVIEGDAVAEESYLETAEAAIDAATLTKEKSEELINGGEAVLEQAQEKAQIVEETYNEIAEYVDGQGKAFKNSLSKRGLNEYVEKLDATTDVQEKIAIIDETNEIMSPKYQEKLQEYNELQEQFAVISKKDDEERAEKEAKLQEAIKAYEEAKKQYEETEKELKKFKSEVDVKALEAEAPGYNEYLKELNALKEAWEISCEQFDEIYYARTGYEENVSITGAAREEALKKMRDLSLQEISDEELAAQVLECAQALEAYNKAVEALENWYSELRNAVDNRQAAKAAYEEKNGYTVNQETADKLNYYHQLTDRLAEQKEALDYADMIMQSRDYSYPSLEYMHIQDRIYDLYDTLREMRYDYDYDISYGWFYKSLLKDLENLKNKKNHADEALQKINDSYSLLIAEIDEYFNVNTEPKDFNKTLEDMRDTFEDMEYADTEINDEVEEAAESIVTDYEEVKKATEAAERDFTRKAEKAGLGEYVERIKTTDDGTEKLAIVDEAIAALQETLNEYGNTIDSEEYKQLLADIAEYEQKLAEAEAEYEATKVEQAKEEERDLETAKIRDNLNDKSVIKLLKKLNKQYDTLEKRISRGDYESPKSISNLSGSDYMWNINNVLDAELAAYKELEDNPSVDSLIKYVNALFRYEECRNLELYIDDYSNVVSDAKRELEGIDAQIYNLTDRGHLSQYEWEAYRYSLLYEIDQRVNNARTNLKDTKSKYEALIRNRYTYLLNASLGKNNNIFEIVENYKELLTLKKEAETIKTQAVAMKDDVVAGNVVRNVTYCNNYSFESYFNDEPIKVNVSFKGDATGMKAKHIKEFNSIDDFIQAVFQAKCDFAGSVDVEIYNTNGNVIASTTMNL